MSGTLAPIYLVARGTSQVGGADFRDRSGAAVIFPSAPRFTVRDAGGSIIVSGTGIQDGEAASLWRAAFSIPEDAPLTTGRWSLSWEGTDAGGGLHRTAEYFMVVDEMAPDASSSDILLLDGAPFSDSLITEMPITELQVRITDSEGRQVYDSGSITPPTPGNDGRGRLYYSHGPVQVADLKIGQTGFNTFFAHWRYRTGGAERVEVHAVYLMGGRLFYQVNALRHYLDKARNWDANPSLRWTDAELVHFLVEGINRINVTEPQLTNWNVASIPQQLSTLVTKAAAHEALNALYLAEGFSAFDFQGQSVQLNVDRTQFISTKMEELNTWLEEHIKKAKRLLVRSRSAGHLQVSLGPTTNWPGTTGYSEGSLSRTMLARLATVR